MDPRSVTHVLYHGDCFDGFGAAFAAWKALGGSARYLPVKYGQPTPELPPESQVVLVDFSFPREELLDLRGRVRDLLVLDHHKTAAEHLRGLDFAHLVLDRAGSGLSWEFFHPGAPEPLLLQYVEDRDLWRFRLPDSHLVHAALASYPLDFAVWDSLTVELLREEGVPLMRYRRQAIRQTADRAGFGVLGGHRVPVVNAAGELRSDVGHELLERHPEAPFAALWFVDSRGAQAWSLRSRGDFDVAALAETFGGGGHPAASGFVLPPGGWLLVPEAP